MRGRVLHSPLGSAEPDRYPAVTLSLVGTILISSVRGGGPIKHDGEHYIRLLEVKLGLRAEPAR